MTSRRRSSLTSKVHRCDPLAWAERAACKGLGFGFTDWDPPEIAKVCAVCPVRRDCHQAGLTPRQIGAMP